MAKISSKRAQELVDLYKVRKGARGSYESHLQEIADYMMPYKASIVTSPVEGAKRTIGIYDTTGIQALNIASNGVYSHMTNPSSPWFELTMADRALVKRWDVKDWLRECSQRMQDAINSSNFGMAAHEAYTDWLGFGTGLAYCEEGVRNLLNFKAFCIANTVVAENGDGNIDSFMRMDRYSARQCFMNWGDKISKAIQAEYEKGNVDKKFEILHVCQPRYDRLPRYGDALNKSFLSAYIEVDTANILAEGGYDECPYFAFRYRKDSNETLGRGPGMDALPDVKMVNEMSKSSIKVMQKTGDPPILVPDELRLYPLRLNAGGINYFKAGDKPEYLVPPWQGVKLPLEYEESRRQRIRELFFADLFLLLAQQPRVKTATEVYELVEERLMLLGPYLGRLMDEFFSPMIKRVFWIMMRRRALPPPPPAVRGAGIEITYISKLALAMRQHETNAVRDSLAFSLPIFEKVPETADVWNFDNVVRGDAERRGVPTEYLNSDSIVRRIRAKRAALRAAEEKMVRDQLAAEQAAKMGPVLSRAPEPGSPIEKIATSIQNQTAGRALAEGIIPGEEAVA